MNPKLSFSCFVFLLLPLIISATQVCAEFKNGQITIDDIKGYIDFRTIVFVADGTIVDYKNFYTEQENLKKVIQLLAVNRIINGLVKEEWLKSDTLFQINLQVLLNRVSVNFLDLVYVYPQLKLQKQVYDKSIIDYYEQHKDSEFFKTIQVKFRIIFFDAPTTAPEQLRSEKYQKAISVWNELQAAPEKFLPLAQIHSEVKLEKRGAILGPYSINSLDKNLSQALLKIQPLEITPVLETRHGFIIARLEHIEKDYFPLEQVKESIIHKIGTFQGHGIRETFIKSLIGQPTYTFYIDKITTDPAGLNDVIAEVNGIKLTNSELPTSVTLDDFFFDSIRYKSQTFFEKKLTPILEHKLIVKNAQEKGLFNNPRYQRLERIAREYYIAKWPIESPVALNYPELKFLKEPNADKILLEQHNFKLIYFPTIDELF